MMQQPKIENPKHCPEQSKGSNIVNDFAALGLIIALVLLFFWRILTPRLEDRATFPPGDFTDQFWAFRMYTARAFAAGRLPLWSDNFYSGHPFLADVQSAIFYPISLVWTLIVVAQRGANFTLFDLEVEAILHFVLAGAFTYLFARRIIGSRVAALVSALIFTFSGYLTSYPPQQLAILETATWLPLILFFLDRGIASDASSPISNHQSLNYIAAGIALGIAALAGHPQTLLFVGYACVIYFVWRVASGEWRERNAHRASRITYHVLHFALMVLIALGIFAAQWIPSLEYQLVSTRAAITWAEAARGFSSLDPLQMILPGFTSAFQSPLYVGIVPLWLAIFALWIKRSREKNFWALLALGSLLVAFGFYVFAYALFYLFAPGFALFRGQERLALVISFALAILAGYGFRDLQSSFDLQRARRAWALLPAGIVLGLMFVCALYISGTLRPSGRVAFLGDRAALVTLLFILTSALIAWRLRSQATPLFSTLSIALIVFELFSVNTQAYNATPQERYPRTSLIQTIQDDREVFRAVDEGKLPGHFGIAYDLEEIGGISPLKIARYDFLRENLAEEKLWRLLNVRYIVTERPGFANAELVANDGHTRLLRLNDALPRAWFVASALYDADDARVLAAMASDSFDPTRVVYLADTQPSARAVASSTAAPPAEFQHIAPERARVTLDAPSEGWLVVSANYYYPGWRARVDGIETPIARANIALCAVPVRAGAHHIELVFEPWSVKIGVGVTLVTIVFLGLALGIVKWRVR